MAEIYSKKKLEALGANKHIVMRDNVYPNKKVTKVAIDFIGSLDECNSFCDNNPISGEGRYYIISKIGIFCPRNMR